MSTTDPAPDTPFWRRLIRVPSDVFWGAARDDCLGLSAQVAYYGLLSLFPFLLFLRSLVPHLPGKGQVVESTLDGLRALVTQDSRLYEIVRDNIVDQLDAGNPTLLSVGIVLTLWSASSAYSVLIKAVNRAYGVGETRSWQHRRLLAVALTLMTAVLLPAGMSLVLLGPTLGGLIGRVTGAGSLVHVAWLALRWPAVFLLLVVPMTIIYYFAPNVRQRPLWVLPGSLFSVGAIIGLSLAFSWFIGLNLFELKWFTYGAIGTVIVILFWMYMMGFAILVGAELNDAVGRLVGRPPRSATRARAAEEEARGAERKAHTEGGGDADEKVGSAVGPRAEEDGRAQRDGRVGEKAGAGEDGRASGTR